MKKDIEIAREAKMLHIEEIAQQLNIDKNQLETYGKYKAKLPLTLIDEEKIKKNKLILVTAITPTPSGEGKTTTAIGLSQGMNLLNHKTTVVIREPSLGPVFGIKGGAAGGGYSQVVPMEDINLHFTGDFAAVEKAHNLLSAIIDNNLHSKTRKLGLDPKTIAWKRVIDMNDRALRNIVIGHGVVTPELPRESGFDITAASEIMAILCIAKDLEDLKKRLGNIFVGFTYDKKPVYARDLNAQGAMAALLKEAIKPNLVQTLENTPAIIHGGPFANIAQGTNSLIATKIALSLSDYVITEAGFASELGAEKFFDIKCQYGNLKPSATVLLVTLKALKLSAGIDLKEVKQKNPDAVKTGLDNLEKHIENLSHFNFKPVIALKNYEFDSQEDQNVVVDYLNKKGISFAINDEWSCGGEGAKGLAEKVVEAANSYSQEYKPLYSFDMSIEDKIKTVSTKMYGAKGVEYTTAAKKKLKVINDLNLNKLPVCIAKTQYSLSDNPKLKNRPKDFVVNIRDIEIAAGAGFVVPIAGSIIRMPGLPEVPAAEAVDIDKNGNITGLT